MHNFSASDSVVILRLCVLYKFTYLLYNCTVYRAQRGHQCIPTERRIRANRKSCFDKKWTELKLTQKTAEPELNPTHKSEGTEPNWNFCITTGNWHNWHSPNRNAETKVYCLLSNKYKRRNNDDKILYNNSSHKSITYFFEWASTAT